MNKLLAGKVVLVTGGARGIGAATCRVLANEGASVAVNYATSKSKAEAVAAQIVAAGGQAKAYGADVTDEAAVKRMIDAIVADFGRIDGVVNNAIAGSQSGAFGEKGWAGYQTMVDYNAKAVYNTIAAARPHFKVQGGGRVVNIVTELWNMAPSNWSMYLAGKGAMVGMSRALAAELGPENITVNMVSPGWMADEKVDTASEGSKNFARTLPLQRHGSADEIGNACVFYLSRLACYVTGTYLPVTGGRITQMGS
jgi:3-oxoacyl-[acyl-carrier protein] reductase